MSGPDLILAVDQGTSSTKVVLVAADGSVVARAAAPLGSSYPRPGWVEQSAPEITAGVRSAVADVMVGVAPGRIAGVALSTQRESMVAWDAVTGEPAGPLISWQDQRTAEACAELAGKGVGEAVRRATGLPLDPMFSGTRAGWLLDQVDPGRSRARAGRLHLGTVDSWLLEELTGAHLTEPGNASRTQLLNLAARAWDEQMLEIFGVPAATLPQVVPSSGPFPAVRGLPPLLDGTPVLAVLADSHAALFAHGAREPGQVKATYGTGSSVMGVCGSDARVPDGLCLTVAWEGTDPVHALEGNIRASGATLTWLARTVGRTPGELAELAATVPSSGGVSLVPAFNGLAAPWWDSGAQGLICGISLGTELAHLARAALESIAFQIEDVVRAMATAVGPVDTLLADGGASENPHLMQLQADLSGRTVHRSDVTDLSPLGAAQLAGLSCGFWTEDQLRRQPRPRTTFTPQLATDIRERLVEGWATALDRVRPPRGTTSFV